jgi:transcriptional regulator with PAS, ATPase and Fis domain
VTAPAVPGLGLSIRAVEKLATALLKEVERIRRVPSLDLEKGLTIRDEVLRYEIELIRGALRLTGNHQSRAAKILGVKSTTLNSKIKRYNIEP